MDCPTCGHPNPADARFCNHCGGALAAGRPEPAESAEHPGLADATLPRPAGGELPPHLAEKARAGIAALEGERKQVTVLFADVQGSMEIAERTDPEALREIMDRFFAILCAGIHRFEGTVDKFTGDGIMALFGAPIAHEDHALRACYAALHLSDELASYSDEVRRTQGLNFSVRMGLNSGEVVVGSIGENLELSYTAIGQTVGLAQRIEALAAPGSAYLAERTAELAEGFFELRGLGPFEVKGLSRPVEVYELAGLGSARGRLDVSRQRGFSRFVGRSAETQALTEALERAHGGDGCVVGVVGDPGVGKSRLCYEFVESARAKGVSIYQAAGLAHAQAVPLLPALRLMRNYFGIAEGATDQEVREKVAGRLLLLNPDFSEELPLLFEFLGVPDPENPAPGIDADARKRRLMRLIRLLVEAQSEREPGITLVEDLHWLDSSSNEFLAGLVRAVEGTKSLVILNFRPEYEAEWATAEHYVPIALEPLGTEAVAELLDDLLGGDPSLDGLAELIEERTEGNPFFVEEVVQELVESGALSGDRGSYRLQGAIEELRVPPTVQSVLAARIDRLPEGQKGILQAAAVIGREFASPVLARITGLEEGEQESLLAALVEAEFLHLAELYPEPVHAFKHPLTQEVAFGSLLAERRRELHAAAAEAIAEHQPERADERAALIAGHWEDADRPLEAARWHARAANWAGYKDPVPTLQHWRRVRELADALPEDDETAALAMTSRVLSIDIGWRLGAEPSVASELFEQGTEIARRRGDVPMLAFFHLTYGTNCALVGNVRRALEIDREALRIADESGDPALRLTVRTGAAYVFFINGLLNEALEATEVGIELGREDPSRGRGIGVTSPYAFCVMFRAGILSNLGRLEEARAQNERAGEVAREEGDLEAQAWNTTNWAHLAWSLGEPEVGLSHMARGIEIAERIGDSFTRAWVHSWRGILLGVSEDWEGAMAEQSTAIEIASSAGVALDTEPWRLAWLADATAHAGDPERGLEHADEAVRLATERQTTANIGIVYWVRGRVLMALRGAAAADQAREALEAALESAREVGYPTGIFLLDRARLAKLEGNERECERVLREARAVNERIGASGWLRRVDEELSELAAAR